MRVFHYTVAGEDVTINRIESADDRELFETWMSDNARRVLAVDTETTGLRVFSHGFDVRLVQIGTATEAWVIPAAEFHGLIAYWLRRHQKWVSHNWSYDAQAVERVFGVTIEEMAPKMFDTMILSKLIQPYRPAGHKLKGLSAEFIDPNAADTQEGLTGEFKKIGYTKDTGWPHISLDNELYNIYAGLDVIYTSRLFLIFTPKIKELMLNELTKFEHTIQTYLNIMRRKGLRVDLDYASSARNEFLEESEYHLAIARDEYGLENLNSTQQVAAALIRSGAELTKTTDSGQFKTGKEILLPLAGMDEYWADIPGAEVNPLAGHIAKGKRAERWANAYLGKFIDLADPAGRIHPEIVGLEARTSRMAVSQPPLQQLPSNDWKVRRAILADPGMDIISADYAQIEMRLVAELAGIKKMKAAIEAGVDLHGYTAELAYGPDFTPENRKHMKGAGFGIVYGGGATGLAPKLGITLAQARNVVRTYNRVYPEIKRWSNKLQRQAKDNNMLLISPSGRLLQLDRDRTYAAINYMVQSTAADVLKNAMEALFTKGLGDHLLMPIHDELIAQAPHEDSAEVAHEIGEAMDAYVGTMHLEAEGEVYGDNWGMGYKGPAAFSLAA